MNRWDDFRNKELDPLTVKVIMELCFQNMFKDHDRKVENDRLRGIIKMMHPEIDIDRFIHKSKEGGGNIEW